jgi:hypothetical protein
LYLEANGRVAVGETDGPIFVEASGQWEQSGHDFIMSITRRYEAGAEEREATSMGVFEFEVERVFKGQLTMIGELMGVEGAVWSIDDLFGDKEVGFFNMIDTTKARFGEDDNAGTSSPRQQQQQFSPQQQQGFPQQPQGFPSF